MNNNRLKNSMLLIAVIVLSTIACGKKPAVKSIETDEVLISVSYADESFFEKYRSYERYDINNEYGHEIAFIPNVPVKDFSWLSVGFKWTDDGNMVYDDDGGFVFEVIKELYRVDELLPQKPLVVSWAEVGMMSVFGYSYRDTDGQKKYFVGMVRDYGGDEEEEEAEGGNAPKEPAGPDFIIWQFFPEETEPDSNQTQKLVSPVIFNNETIPMTVYYSHYADDPSYYVMESLSFEYDGKNHSISLDGLETFPFEDSDNFDLVGVADYNFDNYMDIAILAGQSVKGSWDQIFIYNPQKKSYYRHEELSEMPYIWIDNDTNSIKMHGNNGHAGLLYTSEEYKWVNGQLTLIYRAVQDYNEELEKYVLTIKTLQNGVWAEETETFTEEELN